MKIKVGDTVLCKQERKNSLTPLYDPEPKVVIVVKGSICLSTILEPVKDTRAYLLLATFNLFSLFIYFCLLISFAPLRSIHVMGEM